MSLYSSILSIDPQPTPAPCLLPIETNPLFWYICYLKIDTRELLCYSTLIFVRILEFPPWTPRLEHLPCVATLFLIVWRNASELETDSVPFSVRDVTAHLIFLADIPEIEGLIK